MDIDAARKAGYTDAEIADELGRRTGRNAAGARSAGYSDAEIINDFAQASERGAGRSLALGTRNVLEGLGGVVGSITSPIANLADRATGGTGNRFQNPGKAAADAMGLPHPLDSRERIAGSAIEAGAGALPFMGAGLAAQGAKVIPSTVEALGELGANTASGAAMGGARENGAGTAGQVAAGLAGGLVPSGAAAGLRGAKNTLGGLVNQDKLAAFRNAGYQPPSLGAVSDSGAVQMLESGLGQGLTSAGVMKRAQERGQDVFNNVVEDAAARLARGGKIPQDLEAMGNTAAAGAQANKDAFRKAAREAEDTVYGPVNQLPAKIDNLQDYIDLTASQFSPEVAAAYRARMGKELGPVAADAQPRLTLQGAPISSAEVEAQPFLRNVVEEVPGGLNVASLRNWKGGIGERMDNPGVATINDATEAELRQLYGNASKDIEAALPPDALEKLHNYNAWYSQNIRDMEDVQKAFFSGNSKDPAAATARAILTADAGKLEKLRKVVGPEVFAQLQASALREISRGQRGMSPASAATKLSEGRTAMNPQAREMLFGGDMMPVRDVANALQGARALTNTSNTAGASHVLNAASLGGAGLAAWAHNPAMVLGSLMTPYVLARGVTSPRVINALGNIQQKKSLLPNMGSVGGQAVMRALMGQ